jgi:DNA ligase-like protein
MVQRPVSRIQMFIALMLMADLDRLINPLQTAREKIKQRRSQMIVHSYIYYWLSDSVVSDDQWQEWANELEALQKEYGEVIGFYDEHFKDWTGATGCSLPKDPWVHTMATRLIRYDWEYKKQERI